MQSESGAVSAQHSAVSSILVWLGLFLATALMVVLMPMWVLAAEESESESGKPAPGIQLSGFMINGRFDLTYEKEKFTGNPEEGKDYFKNYHHFVFLSRRKKDEPFSFSAEIVDFKFFEVGVKLGKNRLLKFGKIFMPFGADPLFHRAYGGLTGFDQKLVPFLWTTYGGSFLYPITDRPGLRIDNEFYVVPGPEGKLNEMVDISKTTENSGQAGAGDRLRLGAGKYSVWGSFYWNQYFSDSGLFLVGLDAAAAYGFLPVGPLSNLSLKAGFIKAYVRGSERVEGDSTITSYYHFGDYLQVDYKLPWDLRCRYRTGFVSLDNIEGFYFDKDRKDEKDMVSHNVGLWWDYKILSTGIEYFVNLEAANEQPNDLVRLAAVIEF
ncbi:MAG: hypothetical protein HYT87_03045 [Nitrospirae bacterium]|nr:hypothetical protein [Nitrospirota bacterium]